MGPPRRRRNAGRGRTWSPSRSSSSVGDPDPDRPPADAGLRDRYRPVRPVGPRDRGRRTRPRLRPEPVVPAGHGLDLGPARRHRARIQDRHGRVGPVDRDPDEAAASLADLGLAALAGLRASGHDRSGRWSSAAIVLFHPAVIDVSMWWGQYESIYLFFALAAVVFALDGRNGLAAAAIAVCLMTKPQALPFILPFAAWFWAHGGWREVVTDGCDRLGASSSVLWLPFIPAGGPLNYLHTSANTRARSSRSCRSTPGTSGGSSSSSARLAGSPPISGRSLGPITLRMSGMLLTGLSVTRRRPDHRPRSDATDVHPGPRRFDLDLRSRS